MMLAQTIRFSLMKICPGLNIKAFKVGMENVMVGCILKREWWGGGIV